MVKEDLRSGKTRRIKLSLSDCVQLSVMLVPGTEEFRAYTRIKRKYLAEMNERQKDASDDEPCKTHLGNSELVRGSLFALDDVPQKDLPNYIHAAWKPKGRPTTNAQIEEPDDTASDSSLNDQATVFH
jgi:hypothetical protein